MPYSVIDALKVQGNPTDGIMSAMSEIEIRPLTASPTVRDTLSEILIEVVANGGSVSFMHPLERDVADAFWTSALAAADRGERIIPGARHGRCGTVDSLPPDFP